jgi:formylglycine-generating enzyme required for sulfatase activity
MRFYGWYLDNSQKQTHAGAQLRPSLGGLFDMHGNVLECCQDWLGQYPTQVVSAAEQQHRVLRGGAWDTGVTRCRSAYRRAAGPGGPVGRLADGGIRLVMTLIPD